MFVILVSSTYKDNHSQLLNVILELKCFCYALRTHSDYCLVWAMIVTIDKIIVSPKYIDKKSNNCMSCEAEFISGLFGFHSENLCV